MVSCDITGNFEYWSPETKQRPENVQFDFMLETDIFQEFSVASEKALSENRKSERLKDEKYVRVVPIAMCLSPNGEAMAVRANDNLIRVFDFSTGKLAADAIDENMEVYEEAQKHQVHLYKMDTIEFGRLVAIEREFMRSLANDVFLGSRSMVFDESSRFLMYSTMLGIKGLQSYFSFGVLSVGCSTRIDPSFATSEEEKFFAKNESCIYCFYTDTSFTGSVA